MKPTRREALKLGTLAVTGAMAASHLPQATAAEDAFDWKAAYVDGHSHIWSPDVKTWPLANGQTEKDLSPPSFTDEEVLKAAQAVGVGRVVLIQHHIYHGWDNSYLINAYKQHPGRFAVTAMVDETKPHVDARMRELKEQGVRAFRITSLIRGKDAWLDGPGADLMWKTAATTGQVLSTLINPEDLAAIDRMCAKFPETTVVIDHFGRLGMDGPPKKGDLDSYLALAKHKKVYCKLSAFYALGYKKQPHDELIPMIKQTIDAYGVERCLWASDAPYQLQGDNSYKSSIDLIKDRIGGLSAGDKKQLLRETALKVYF